MPEDPVAALSWGFYGKIPGRGDFVRAGLPRGFVAAWDGWLSQVLPASRAAMGGRAWLDAWMEAPVWRFALAPGLCGADAALGLWMPSVDRAGRHFPLTLAATFAALAPAESWLDAAEKAGRAALESDIGPDELLSILPAPEPSAAGPGPGARWWTDGAPRVPAGRRAAAGLPDCETFRLMLDSGAGDAAVS